MAYYFMIKGKNNQQIALDISKSKCFTRLSKYKNERYSLEEIDMFTMTFNTEDEIKKTLIEEEISERQLTTRILHKGSYNKIMYDFLLQKDIIYIANPNLLIKRIENKLDTGNYRFVKEFASFFLNYHEVGSTAPEVREFATSSAREGKRSRHFDELDENGDKPLVRMCKLLIFEHTTNRDGTITYSQNKKYINLHKVLAFVNHYDKKYQKKKQEETKYSEESSYFQENFFDMEARGTFDKKENDSESNSGTKTSFKKRVLKPEYGRQLDLFDTYK